MFPRSKEGPNIYYERNSRVLLGEKPCPSRRANAPSGKVLVNLLLCIYALVLAVTLSHFGRLGYVYPLHSAWCDYSCTNRMLTTIYMVVSSLPWVIAIEPQLDQELSHPRALAAIYDVAL
ncbi:hypothetical protein PYCCODRAFT_442848 [Trametes coccinea BRFM310]|uniref:Uncharacterized protein n=1 Tax=Trametes coccinea (strain BRFM310) TaxID=1353009 RepID=A0A1Y2IN96_TRAC3|nr:hypothetical protein PYCCODRAFT_442848 [Trametes coccinea BRFM310]